MSGRDLSLHLAFALTGLALGFVLALCGRREDREEEP